MSTENENTSLGYWVGTLSSAMRKQLDRDLSEFDVTAAQWAILETCYHGRGNTVSDIAGVMPVDQAAISRHVDRLCSKGLLNRRRSSSDRRSVRITLTRAGRELVPKLAPKVQENNETFMKSLDENEQVQLIALIQKVVASYEADDE